jgi:uncharacterized membrane protein YhdT
MEATLNTPQRTGYYGWFVRAAVLVLGVGVGLHVALLLFGRDWLPQGLAVSAFLVLAVLSPLIALGLWAFRRGQRPGDRRGRLRYGVAAVYSTVAVLVHFGAYLTQRTELLRSFPDWFGFVVVGLQLALVVALWRASARAGVGG